MRAITNPHLPTTRWIWPGLLAVLLAGFILAPWPLLDKLNDHRQSRWLIR